MSSRGLDMRGLIKGVAIVPRMPMTVLTGSGSGSTWTANVSGCRYGVGMTAQPENDPGSYEVIHLGGEVAAIVPLPDLRRLQAVHRHASAEQLEEAEVEATLTAHREWVAAGRPGAVSHEEAMAELLGGQ